MKTRKRTPIGLPYVQGLDEVPEIIAKHRSEAEKRLNDTDDALDKLKLFAVLWEEEQKLWEQSHAERKEIFQKNLDLGEAKNA
jgi:hypothetical protein